MSTQFKSGDEVYSINGRAGYYVARGSWGHIVEPIHESDDGEPVYSDAETWRQVFHTPPRERVESEIGELEKRRDAARMELDAITAEMRNAKAEREKALKALASHPDLTPVIEYMEGRITHAATIDSYSGGIKIQAISDAVLPESQDDRRNGDVRLLALYGGFTRPDGKVGYQETFRWRLSHYRDGSGNQSVCILGTSEESVRERLQAHLDEEFKKRGVHSDRVLIPWARSAIHLGLRVPQDLADKIRDADAKAFEFAQKKAREQLASLESQAAALRAKLAPVGGEA